MTTIRPAEPADVDAVADLLVELDTFYGEAPTDTSEERALQIRDALFGTPPAASVLLARHDDELIGLASYSLLWPAEGVTRSLYLKELYVKQGHRRSGVGGLLMEQVFGVAEKLRCSRVEWTTEIENVGARQFYRALEAEIRDNKLHYRMRLPRINQP